MGEVGEVGTCQRLSLSQSRSLKQPLAIYQRPVMVVAGSKVPDTCAVPCVMFMSPPRLYNCARLTLSTLCKFALTISASCIMLPLIACSRCQVLLTYMLSCRLTHDHLMCSRFASLPVISSSCTGERMRRVNCPLSAALFVFWS